MHNVSHKITKVLKYKIRPSRISPLISLEILLSFSALLSAISKYCALRNITVVKPSQIQVKLLTEGRRVARNTFRRQSPFLFLTA